MSTVLRKSRTEGGWSIEVEKDLMPEIHRNIAMLGAGGGLRATCGIHHDAGLHPMYHGKPVPQVYVPTAQLAKIQEYGDISPRIAFGEGNTPPRPFLRDAFRLNLVQNQHAMKGVVEDALNRKFDKSAALKIATDQAHATKEYIRSDPFEPLSGFTMRDRDERKTFVRKRAWVRWTATAHTTATPLMDSGQLLNDIKGKVGTNLGGT